MVSLYLQLVSAQYLQLIYRGYWEWWPMINALVAALEGFHHIFPGALIQEEVDRYCIEQRVFTCAYTMIVCLQDWRSKGDTDSEMIKNVSNKMSNDVQRFELGHFITTTFILKLGTGLCINQLWCKINRKIIQTFPTSLNYNRTDKMEGWRGKFVLILSWMERWSCMLLREMFTSNREMHHTLYERWETFWVLATNNRNNEQSPSPWKVELGSCNTFN